MKTVSIISVFLMLLMISSLNAAEVTSITALKGTVEVDKVIVPIGLNNVQAMAALDLPLKFSEGVTLEEVSFAGTRSENFDFATAKIDNENSTVVLGLIPMVYGENPDLTPGTGEIARLIFHVDDPSLKSLEITVTSLDEHTPMFVYTEMVNGEGQTMVSTPEFPGVTVALVLANSSETPAEIPATFALMQNAPNPFNPQTNISYDLPAAAHVTLDILNVLGQRVKTLVNDYREAGSYSIIWDGRGDDGSATASGVYFYRITAGNDQAVKKMMMLK